MVEQDLAEEKRKKLERDSQLFEVLCRDYTSVYYLDMQKGEAEYFKVEQGANANKVLKSLVGTKFDYNKMMGLYIDNYVDAKDRQAFKASVALPVLIKELRRRERLTFRYKSIPNDDGQQYFEMRVVRLNSASFDYKVLVGFRHIDELVAAEQANVAKTEFLSQVAHDIRTPLNAILGFVEIAKSQLDNKEQLEYALEKITTSGRYLTELVNDVLDLSKIENGQMELHPERISLQEFFANMSPLMELHHYKKQLDISCKKHDLEHDLLLVDPLRLRQICTNLLSNAVKYTPAGGRITLELSEEPAAKAGEVWLVLNISDTGIGMSPEFMKHMYSRFSRATDIRTSYINGHGLGLAIVRELVEMLNGTITAKSKLGEGTSFCVRLLLPYVETDGEEQLPQPAVDSAVSCKGMHLLVAEDNKLNYEVASLLLEMQGISCERAVDGADCLKKFTEASAHTYNAILMDMQMPVMDGLQATRAIRHSLHPEARTIPIIAMTANAFSEDIRKCLDAGMQEHLSKPLDMKKLLQVLAKYA